LAEKKSAQPKKSARGGRKGGADAADPVQREMELREELFRLRFQFATRQLTNTSRVRQVRREIARQKTLQRQRELAAQVGG
jgi:large subunit ribosomal protein L29